MPFVIDDTTPVTVTHDPAFARGAVPRDLRVDPPEMFSPPTDIPDMPFQEIADRIKDHNKYQSSLLHIRRTRGPNNGLMDALDQNGQGFCWAYSVAGTIMAARLRDHQPFVKLSPHAVACKIKGFRDEGGWCGLSARFARGQDPNFPGLGGYPSEEYWPARSMSRSNDKAETWANAKLHMVTEDYVDLARPVYDQNLTKKQVLIQVVLLNPCACDFNWWSHSVLILFATLLGNPTNPVLEDFGLDGLNSWSNNWGDKGEFELRGSKSNPDGAICTRGVTGAPT